MEDDLTPTLGKEFNSLEEAWKFWVNYAGKTGFGARKHTFTKSKKDGSIISYRYVCCKEGWRKKDKRDVMTINPRPETRIGCKAKMGVARVNDKYKIDVFIEEHNHPLHLPETVHMLPSQRKLTKIQAYQIDLAEDAGIQQKSSFELMSRHAGGRANLGYTRLDAKNYLNSKRQRSMVYGEAGCLLQYFQKQYSKNPSFYHAYQMDKEEQITNVFWADARMLIDYVYFGEVVSMDTTYSTNRDHRPLAIFSGFNHYRGAVIFGAALLYDETTESFKWLLETFLEAHKKKKPLIVFTDQDQAMTRALHEVLPETKHGLCTWHLKQNGIKHLRNLMKHGSHFLSDFSKCMHEYVEETQFETAWSRLLETYNVQDNTWLKSIYNIKEKWAKCHMNNIVTLGMQSTQLSESLNADIKSCTKPDIDINQFFKHFERVVEDKRYNELIREFESRQKMPRLIVQSSPMLRQLAQIYTTPIFELFQEQWDLFAAACITHKNEIGPIFEYIVNMVDENGKWIVHFDPNNRSILCSCRKFETWGILCCHALKVYDVNDVKKLPEPYILKRWTKEARSGIIYDIRGNEVQADLKHESTQRYRQLCPIMIRLASEASDYPETFSLVHKGVIELSKQVTEFRSSLKSPNNDSSMGTTPPTDSIMQPRGFKKRDGIRRKKRLKSWPEKLLKKRRRPTSTINNSQNHLTMDDQMQASTSSTAPFMQQGLLTSTPPTSSEFTFTQMLMAPPDCPIPSLEALEFSEDILRGSASFLAGEASHSQAQINTARANLPTV